jgi:transcriptional regulator with XRE-family HTH domain
MVPCGPGKITLIPGTDVHSEEKITMSSRDNPENVRMVVAFLRLLRGWSQAELAEAVGLSVSAIWRYENEDVGNPDKTLEEIAVAVGLPPRMLDRLFTWIAAARAAVASAADPEDPLRRIDAIAAELAAGLSDIAYAATAEILGGSPDLDEIGPWAKTFTPPRPEDRDEALELWERLARREPSARRMLVEESKKFRKWALCELLCAESVQAAALDTDQALELAELALLIAELAPGEESWRQRLQGYAWAHVGNARRARGDRPGARDAFAHACSLWEAGASGDPGLLEESRVRELVTSPAPRQ